MSPLGGTGSECRAARSPRNLGQADSMPIGLRRMPRARESFGRSKTLLPEAALTASLDQRSL